MLQPEWPEVILRDVSRQELPGPVVESLDLSPHHSIMFDIKDFP
jgi:hypothetical protein